MQDIDTQERRDRIQREAQLRESERAHPAVRLGPKTQGDFHRIDLPVERDCFRIRSIALDGAPGHAFDVARRYVARYAGRCLGHDGINLLVRRVSDLIIDHGFVTTRVGLAPQDLGSGVLRLTVVPGRVGEVRLAAGSADAAWRTALPARRGDLLNLRDIEQGLEQFKRVPSQDVDIDIAPGIVPGESDLVVTVRRTRPWHFVASYDDTGVRATGRLQGNINLAIDNPLRVNDVLSLGYTHNLPVRQSHGTRGSSASYALPLGYSSLSIGIYDYQYRQTVVGSQQSFLSRGKSRTVDMSLQRVIHRSRQGKTSLELRVGKRWAHHYIEDAELLAQQRNVTTLEVAAAHRAYLGSAQVNLRLSHRRGVSWLHGQRDRAPRGAGAPTFEYQLNVLDASLSVPFAVGPVRAQWTSEFRGQRSSDVLYGSEYLAIGGRHSVRGFDGEQTLAGERGWYWRNALSVPLGSWPVAVYAGVDGGHVGGPGIEALQGKTLRGEFIGLRGNTGPLSFDLFAGWADQGGRALAVTRPATGFQLIYQY